MKRYFVHKIVSLLVVMLLTVSVIPLQTWAAETDTGNSANIVNPYLRVDLLTLYSEGRLSGTPETSEVEITEDEAHNGIKISGPASEFKTLKLTIQDAFRFNGNPVGRICVDGLSDAGISADVQFYLDDSEEPSATISLVENADWSKEGNRTVDVYAQTIRGEHQVSIGFDVTGQSEETVSILLRNLEFAENSIPVLYFELDESRGTIDDMNASQDHSANCYGAVNIQVPAGYQSEYMDSVASDLNDLKLEYIRGRGNSTWSAEKKAYKVKFEKKQDLFGMGENKHWVLIANRYDNTLLHNRITYRLAAEMGMRYTPQCIPVEVVMNGRYFGSYLLCEQLRVGDNRIEIDELTAEDTAEPKITGGYFLSLEPYENDPAAGKFTTREGMNFYINDPGYEEAGDAGTAAHRAYISQYAQATEDAIFGEDFKDANGKSYQEYLDIDSAVDYWWVQEFSTNHDAYKTPSTYLYKERNGKLYWGPVWDFDSEAYGNLMYDPAWYAERGFFNTSTDTAWMTRMMLDKEFSDKLYARWTKIDQLLDEIVKDGGILDQYYHETEISQRYDNELYGYYDPTGQIKEDPDHTYSTDIEQFRSWMKARQAWINANIDFWKNPTCSFTFMVDGQDEPVAQEKVLKYQPPYMIPKAPEKEGFLFLGWEAEDGTMVDEMDWLESEKDVIFYASYLSEEDAILADDIFFQLPEFWTELNNETFMIMYKYEIVPEDTQEKMLKWTSSDESIATVDEFGQVFFHSAGTVNITATLRNGKSKSYQLHIVDAEAPEYAKIEGLSFEQDTIAMQVGDYSQNVLHISPGGLVESDLLSFTSDNEEVVTVDSIGVLHAVGEGTAVITVTDDATSKTASYTVNVSAKTDEKDSEEIVYTFSKGGNGTWITGSSGTFDLTVHRNIEDDTTFSHFKDIAVDGTVIDAKNYDAVSGSLNASVKADYLNTLSAGEHSLTVHFDDGAAETKLIVKESAASDASKNGTGTDSSKNSGSNNNDSGKSTVKNSSSVDTGDTMNVSVWLITLLAAMAGLGMMYCVSKKANG